MPIKTLHITNAYHPSSGGISTFYRALFDTANQLERPMRLVVPAEATRSEEVGRFGRIYYLAAPRAPHLVVAGAGPLAAAFAREAIQRVPGRITLLGHMTGRAKLIALYANADAFVHPNPREPFGIAPLEAMAAGLPLVAPRAGGVLSYADEHNAWLAEANAISFAAAVRAVFADPSARKEKLTRARWVAQAHAWPAVAARFFALYDQLHAAFPVSRFAQRLPAAGHRLPVPSVPPGGLAD